MSSSITRKWLSRDAYVSFIVSFFFKKVAQGSAAKDITMADRSRTRTDTNRFLPPCFLLSLDEVMCIVSNVLNSPTKVYYTSRESSAIYIIAFTSDGKPSQLSVIRIYYSHPKVVVPLNVAIDSESPMSRRCSHAQSLGSVSSVPHPLCPTHMSPQDVMKIHFPSQAFLLCFKEVMVTNKAEDEVKTIGKLLRRRI